MGQYFDQESFSQSDFSKFENRLIEQVDGLKSYLIKPEFAEYRPSIGAELEMYIVDREGNPSPINQTLIDKFKRPQLQQELNKFNLELNLSPVDATGYPFTEMGNELRPLLSELNAVASEFDTQIVPIGILPTLQACHLERENMSDIPRYRALANQLSRLRGSPFAVEINGIDSLKTECNEVTLEGANTSFQIHLRVPSDRFKNMFNAAQLITPLVLAVSCNSPTFLGKRLWQETRIALFKQSIDNRLRSLTEWRQPSRVTFGHGWIRNGAWECFAENVALYPPILPYCFDSNEMFAELNLHHGTIWSWNRAVLQPGKNKHLRIEFRAFPAGPTITDMMANAALAIGLTVALSHNIEAMLVKMPFQFAEYNFYRAAQSGLEASIIWPNKQQHKPSEHSVKDILTGLLASAAEGLSELGVSTLESSHLLSVIEQRLATGQTGAVWQLNKLSQLTGDSGHPACNAMLHQYVENSHAGHPIATWS